MMLVPGASFDAIRQILDTGSGTRNDPSYLLRLIR